MLRALKPWHTLTSTLLWRLHFKNKQTNKKHLCYIPVALYGQSQASSTSHATPEFTSPLHLFFSHLAIDLRNHDLGFYVFIDEAEELREHHKIITFHGNREKESPSWGPIFLHHDQDQEDLSVEALFTISAAQAPRSGTGVRWPKVVLENSRLNWNPSLTQSHSVTEWLFTIQKCRLRADAPSVRKEWSQTKTRNLEKQSMQEIQKEQRWS